MTSDRARRRYRVLLRLAPRRLRARHAEEMEEAFLDAWQSAGRRGAAARLATWLGAAADLALIGFRRRLQPTARLVNLPRERPALMTGTEFRYALRTFRRQPLPTLLILVMLTLGMAATTLVFSVVNSLLLRPFPFPEPDRLVYVNERAPRWNLERTGVNYPDFDQWRKAAQAFDGLAIFDDVSFNLSDDEGAERIAGARVTHDFLPVLGVAPISGRLFTADEDKPGGPRVALISEQMWRERFASDEGVLSRTLRLNGVTFNIIGVVPRHAEFPVRSRVWIPLAGDPNQQGQSYSYDAIGRLKPGVTAEAAEADLLRAHQPIFDARDKERIVSPFVRPLHDTLVRDYRTVAQALFAAVILLLVVACANVAAVMLARAIDRRREMGIRLAVGANRWRLLRQLFVENVLLAVAGGVLGLVLGRWVLGALLSAAGDGLPAWATFAIDGRTVLFSVLAILGTAVLFGWAPAWHAIAGDLRSAMSDASPGSTTSPSGRRTLTGLVAAEFALAAVLIVGGSLLFRAFGEVRRVDPGFDADRVLTFSVALPGATYRDGEARLGFWNRLLERLRAAPGVERAGVITCPPLTCHWGNFYRIEGRPPRGPDDPDPVVLSRIASEGYVESMGLRLVAGRSFDARDGTTEATPVVIVNEMFARTFWPGEADVLGKRIAFQGDGEPWMSVIGVTADIKHYGLEQPMRPGLYFPMPSMGARTSSMAVAVRTALAPESFAGTARAIVHDLDPTLPLYRVQTMEQALADSVRTRATYSWMLAVFAGLALVLALGGTYGVTSYLVTQRHREIGIRLAMGARTADIVRGVLRGSLVSVTAGVALGLVGAVALGSLLTDLLFGVSPRDPVTIAAAALTLATTAVAANWLPARRAARTSPMTSLRA